MSSSISLSSLEIAYRPCGRCERSIGKAFRGVQWGMNGFVGFDLFRSGNTLASVPLERENQAIPEE